MHHPIDNSVIVVASEAFKHFKKIIGIIYVFIS